MNRFKRINDYFFIAEEGETIHWSDLAWFYGFYGFCIVLTFITLAL